jgi:hypothetical protein
VVSLHSGTARSFEQIRLLAALCTDGADGEAEIEQRHIGRDGFDPCRDESISSLLAVLDPLPNSLICVDQPFTAPLPDHVVEGITRLKQAAVAAGSHIMLFSSHVPASIRAQLTRIVDEVIDVEECEPEPGARLSFHIRWLGSMHLAGLDEASVMCSVRVTDRRYTYKGERFIAKDVKGRVMWLLRCQGWSLEAIGSLLKLNRSTVKRRLDQLPPLREISRPEDWLSCYRDVLDLPGSEAV